jgi:hypothetical protein
MTNVPIACNLAALTLDQRQQHAALAAQLAEVVDAVEELPNGYAFRYRTDEFTWRAVTMWIEWERRCCPFLTFTLERTGDGPVWLRLTGADGVKEFLAAQLPVG